MASKEMEKLLEHVYKDIDMFDFNGKNVPRIILDDRKFDDMMSKIQGKPISVNTDLNILLPPIDNPFKADSDRIPSFRANFVRFRFG